MRNNWLYLLVVLVTMLFSSCSSQTKLSSEGTSTAIASATPSPTETPTKAPSGISATLAAMVAQTTLVPPTPIGGEGTAAIAADDYVGIFKQAWTIVKVNYVRDNFNGLDWDAIYDEYLPRAEQVQSSEEMHLLLTDLIAELDDSHSRYVPPSRMELEYGVETSGSAAPRPWTGIRFWIGPDPSRDDEYLMAWYVCDIGPAASAGIETGDIILAIDGQEVVRGSEGIDPQAKIAATYGNGGDSVILTIQSGPDQQPRDVTVKLGGAGGCDPRRYEIVSESPRIGYIRIPNFEPDVAFTILSALRDMEKDAPLDGVILDVRHNGGGVVEDALGIFADGLVGTVGPLREGKQRTLFRIRGIDWNDTTPVVVIADANSHSAADYFPASLKELGRATLVGTNSAGNTEGLGDFILADTTLIRLAVSTLLLNDGTSIEGVGVIPDIYVPLGQWGLKLKPYDVQLQAAIDYLLDTIK